MVLKVREVLTPLLRGDLERLCTMRDLSVNGTKDRLITRLAHSYRGDLDAVVDELRREDLLSVARGLSHRVEFPQGLSRLAVADLRSQLKSVFSGIDGEEVKVGGTPSVELYRAGGSTMDGDGAGMRWFDVRTLAREAADANRATVVSAYYVPKMLRELLGGCRGEVRVVLNGLGGRRLERQVKELEDLREKLGRRSKRAGVRLGFADGVFHTKLYLFERGAQAVAWIGSANATGAGLGGHNEEVLVRMAPAPESVTMYAASAWERGVELDQCRQRVSSVPAFFRTGTLYYAPYGVLQKTYNPFRRFVEALPAVERRKISAFHSEFAEDEAGIGAFNLDRVFERAQSDEPTSESATQQVRFRDYAVETCYGYWVPERLVEEVEERLRAASADKRAALERWRDWMSENGETVVEAYRTYLVDARTMLEREGVDWTKYASLALFEGTEAIEGRVATLVAELEDEGRLQRHSLAFVAAEVPEIWEDGRARRDFERSFYDALAIASGARRWPRAARLVLHALGLGSTSAREIEKALLMCVRDESWYEEHFAGAENE